MQGFSRGNDARLQQKRAALTVLISTEYGGSVGAQATGSLPSLPQSTEYLSPSFASSLRLVIIETWVMLRALSI